MFPNMDGLKKEYVLSPVLFHFAPGCAIRRVQGKKDGLKLMGKHHILVCADNDNILG
jgi:hypothetical protein